MRTSALVAASILRVKLLVRVRVSVTSLSLNHRSTDLFTHSHTNHPATTHALALSLNHSADPINRSRIHPIFKRLVKIHITHVYADVYADTCVYVCVCVCVCMVCVCVRARGGGNHRHCLP